MQQNTTQVSPSVNTAQHDDDEIDLVRLVGQLIENKWLIIAFTAVFALAGVAYALLATPIYKADALLQVEKKSSGMPALAIWVTCLLVKAMLLQKFKSLSRAWL